MICSFVLRFALVCCALSCAQAEPILAAIPAGGDALLTGDVGAFGASAGAGNNDAFKFSTVDTQGPTFKRAWRIETNRDLSPAWALEVRVPLAKAVKKGDTGFVHFYARALASADETGVGRIRAVVQQAGPVYTKSLETTFSVGAEWQEYFLPLVFAGDFAAGGAELAFGFGFKRETIEVGGVEVLNYGRRLEPAALPKTRFTYAGREPDAAWRREALARIERLRKSGFAVTVQDAAGQPVAGASVRVAQVRSAFQFGSALQLARLVNDSADNKIYRERVQELFNAASPENDLKWPAWDGEWGGSYSQPQALQALRWLGEKGFHVRGHVLIWPGWKNLPESIRQLRDTEKQKQIPARVLAHIADITGATRGLVQEWDVLNEPFDNRDLMGLFGADIMVEWFKAAAAGAPGLPLYLNDYSNHDLVADKAHCMEFFRVAKFLQSKGAPLGGLGLQGHIGAQPNAPERVLATLDTYAALKLPIRFTEFDIDTDDEALQADYTRDFLILAYSHPSVVGVQHWGFWEKTHWRPQAAMFRNDWSAKPSAAAYRALVLDQWRTKVAGVTDAAGSYSVRGFQGDYAIFVEKDGRKVVGSFVLRPGDAAPVILVKLP